MSGKMALRRFALEAAGGFRGKDAGEQFARGLITCFGHEALPEPDDGGPILGHTFQVHAEGKKAERSVAAYWPERRVVLDVADRDLMLDAAWGELHRACVQMDEPPQYVVLTNQRDVRLYDLARKADERLRLTIPLDELPKYSEAFPFFEADWEPGTAPRIINVDKVSKEVADLVAQVYRALRAEAPEGDDAEGDVIRFILQCIVAMFAEDIGLLPAEYFTTLLYRAAEDGDAAERIAELFRWMSTPREEREEQSAAIAFFNGGLFRAEYADRVPVAIDKDVLRALTKAAEANWTFVDPHIFGSVFQGVMDDAERHASGAHYTAREDIMSVVGPTIVEPWRERIEGAKTLTDLRQILSDLGTYRVLDPACGSGNFLYVAFRELYRLETEVLVRIYDEFPSATKGKGRVEWTSGIKVTNFFGIDINPFAVELARATLNIAKKIAFEQRREDVLAKLGQSTLEVDPSLPLDNLDENIVCEDALFTEWPEADAIIGNPPFLGSQKMREELGGPYLQALQDRYPGARGDFCVYWFRRAHALLPPAGRAGLIATSGVRLGRTRESSLDHIVSSEGMIVHAISSRPWRGEASLNVSVVNWLKGTAAPVAARRLVINDRVFELPRISPHLQLHAPVENARALRANRRGTSLGIIFGGGEFQAAGTLATEVARDGALRAVATGASVLANRTPAHAIWLAAADTEAAARAASPAGFAHLERTLLPRIDAKASDARATNDWKTWRSRWWRAQKARDAFFRQTPGLERLVVCVRVQSRPIFVFLSRGFLASDSLQLFAYDDDYSFGIIQSSLHWAWTKAKGGRLTDRIRYTSKVWKTFPWPQEPTLDEVAAVGQAAQALRATRRELMERNDWSLRDLYRSAEVAGPHPLKEAQAALDAAVEAAYGKPADLEATEFLLEMNLALAEVEAEGESIQGPGLPTIDGEALDPKDPRWFSTDCIEPPPLPGSGEPEGH
jgi:SAM-dependent methyltransferase